MKSTLERHLENFTNTYKSFEVAKKNVLTVTLKGRVDVIDNANHFWGSFRISIEIDRGSYPHVLPRVFLADKALHKLDRYEWHISPNGECCLDIPHKMELLKTRGINLIEFYKTKIYPFFANYCFRRESDNYANGEYAHFDNGIVQFYKEEYDLVNNIKIIELLRFSLGLNKKIRRNDVCPVCNHGKFKKCCLKTINSLKLFGRERLEDDLKIFEKREESSM